jgi:ParB family chromosome partitioning protein
MSAKKRALGRGLDALLGVEPVPITGPDARVRLIPFIRLKPNPYQPRGHFNEEALEELTASIKSNGILQPLVVRPAGDHYEIVAGERRWRAAQLAGLAEVPIIVREFSNREMLELSLIENIQREDLNAIEEANAYRQLIEEFSLTQETVAERMGKSRVAVTNALRLLKLPQSIQDWIVEGRLSAGHARALLALESESAQMALAREVMGRSLSVRDTENRVRQLLKSPTILQIQQNQSSTKTRGELSDLEEKLSLHLGRRVRVVSKANNQGHLEIYYTSLEEFQGIMEQLGIPVEQEI